MPEQNCYDVMKWSIGNAHEDIGAVINSIVADVKKGQTNNNANEGGKPGAVIYIPPGDYHLSTQVVIDISYLKIVGSGHGFVSSSIRYNSPWEEWPKLHEIWPGGSRILVDLAVDDGTSEEAGAAFYVGRDGDPRISSVEFENFCVDGLHFAADGSSIGNPENTYNNGKTGIYVACAQDSFRITGMGLVYLEHGITVYYADALSIHDNFIAECGNCIELRGWGQASKITDNLMGAGFNGYTIFAQNFGGLLITSNNIFPRGASSVHFVHVSRSSVSGNRFHSFYPGMLVLAENCSEDLVASNHFLRDNEPWAPMAANDNGLEDSYGLIYVHGQNNTITANHISETVSFASIKPKGTKPVMIRIAVGTGNYVAGNHIVATTDAKREESPVSERCFTSQVDALVGTGEMIALEAIAVLVEKEAVYNTILDSGSSDQVVLDRTLNAFRATPTAGKQCTKL